MADAPPKPHPRVVGHVETLRAAGLNTQAFFDALVEIRDDSLLRPQHREALYRLIASECFIWYLEALRGEPIDRVKLMQEATKLLEERAAAIMKKMQQEEATNLAQADIGRDPAPPDRKTTVVDRPQPQQQSKPIESSSTVENLPSTPARPRSRTRKPDSSGPTRKPDSSGPTRLDRPPKKET